MCTVQLPIIDTPNCQQPHATPRVITLAITTCLHINIFYFITNNILITFRSKI